MQLGGNYRVEDWTRQHANFFRAVQTEKRVMFIILTLIVAVAAFNIVSTLVMVVTDKQSDIAILRTLGASPRSIMVIFVIQGAVIGLFGTLLGVLGGVTLALNVETIVPAIESLFHVPFLSKDVYYISEVPSDLHWHDVFVMTSVAMVLSLLATLYPAWRAARTHPAEALRYE
jgi:lipoprotein-releasing system permease protein